MASAAKSPNSADAATTAAIARPGNVSTAATARIGIGLGLILALTAVFSWYSLQQIEGLRKLQTNTIDRNRKSSLQLIRIQNNLTSLASAMRDMVAPDAPYPMSAWRSEFQRIRNDLSDAMTLESQMASRLEEQNAYLQRLQTQFWTTADEAFQLAEQGKAAKARGLVDNSLLAQHGALSATVARLLAGNNEAEQAAAGEIRSIYDRVERNLYLFLVLTLASITAIGFLIAYQNRRFFETLATLAEQRSVLAKRMIGLQEEVLRSVSRELHDEFGQILTAIGVMLGRTERRHAEVREHLTEIRSIVQDALQKTRDLSQALHPSVLEHHGFPDAVERYIPLYEKQTGVKVHLDADPSANLDAPRSIHVYRVLQEALTNVARHSGAKEVEVRLARSHGRLQLEVEDHGVGLHSGHGKGLGLVAMHERAELVGGKLRVERPEQGGTLISLEVPID
ncbi:MAG TPA: sensor histidine kinase [Bryobacteraceae bacterium]|nr:sensor histidine kinase [Bryobacteraceae bacterium]